MVSTLAVGFIVGMFVIIAPMQRMAGFALSLILGGAIGNYTDRIRLGYVVDFVDVRLGSSHWPTFNVADAAISLGVIILVGVVVWMSGREWVARRRHS